MIQHNSGVVGKYFNIFARHYFLCPEIVLLPVITILNLPAFFDFLGSRIGPLDYCHPLIFFPKDSDTKIGSARSSKDRESNEDIKIPDIREADAMKHTLSSVVL